MGQATQTDGTSIKITARKPDAVTVEISTPAAANVPPLVMPEGRKIRSECDYIFRLSGISRIERVTVSVPPPLWRQPESSVVNSCVVLVTVPIKDSGLWIESKVAAYAANNFTAIPTLMRSRREMPDK